jgi:SAM-dependent methyltransferase
MESISNNEYLRQRYEPRPGDQFYLHLSDLLLAIGQLKPKNTARVLDYGCGGSPYRNIFRSDVYHRADLVGTAELDFEYRADAKLPQDVQGYDCVLSSQVLEHVDDPKSYLQECYRILEPRGHLLLTTHGLFEDHGCPYDYWRWTVYGLQKLVEAAGFRIDRIKKVTTGPRAAMFLAEREIGRLRFTGAGYYGHALSLGVRGLRRFGAKRRHEACDVSFSRHRVADAYESGHDMYVAIALLACR